jgi:hypothetical protein
LKPEGRKGETIMTITKKTNLKNGLLAAGMFVIMPIAGVMALVSCGNPVIPAEENCDCVETEHLYDASAPKCCDDTNCACRIYYGEVVGLTFNGNNVKIYKKAGANLTPEQMAEAVEKFQEGFDGNSGLLGSGILNDMISEINIFTGSIGYDRYSYDNNMVLDLNFNQIDYAGYYLLDISDGSLSKGDFAMVKPSNNLKLTQWCRAPFCPDASAPDTVS